MPNKFEGHSFDELKGVSQDNDLETKEYRAAKKETVKRAETPTHTELNEVMERSKHDERLDMDIAIVKGALESLDLIDKPLDPAKAMELDEDDLRNLMSKPSNEDDPQIYFKQITRTVKKGLFRKEHEEVTDEILVVIRLNNSSAHSKKKREKEGTVVTAVLKQRKGVIHYGKRNPGLYATQSEGEFNALVNPPLEDDGAGNMVPGEPSIGGELALGRLTNQDYLKTYKKENKQTLQKHWANHDKGMENRVDYWGQEEGRNEMMRRLDGRYTEVLEGLNNQITRIKTETAAAVKESEEKIERLSRDPAFLKTLWNGYATVLRKRNPSEAELAMWEQLMMDKGITKEEIEALKAKLGKKKQ
ncbi:hypothetical protein HN803_06635 [candidate division WWE3 bacterium]|jgi:hypothetical protein|nr:hypothetical protein [candidate division WWE3 bacterium]MBT7350432.1 hypothetical protein [candidate division WWE3 bacterium]